MITPNLSRDHKEQDKTKHGLLMKDDEVPPLSADTDPLSIDCYIRTNNIPKYVTHEHQTGKKAHKTKVTLTFLKTKKSSFLT